MVTVVEFSIPVDEFPLGSVFETLPTVTVELERLVPHGSVIVPYFWVRGADTEDLESAFDAHAGFVSVDLVDGVGDEYLMRAEWAEEYFGILDAVAGANVAVLSGVGRSDGWRFEVRAEDRETIAEFRATCREHEVEIEITAVHALTPGESGSYDLTDAQREALVLAYERGYFDSPRTTTLREIADELGITQQSVSSRLRRGHRRLVAATLITR